MYTVKNIFDYLAELAPLELQENYDNAGFLFGNIYSEVNKVILSLDVTSDVINEANAKGCSLIITHHPLIFGSIKNVYSDNPTGKKLLNLAKSNINVISMHTNLDKILVNKVLIKTISDYEYKKENDYLWSGKLQCPKDIYSYIEDIKLKLNAPGIRFYNSGIKVKKIGCVGGAGEDELETAKKLNIDTFVTSDIRHHSFLAAKELGINLIDANHFSTENIVIPELKSLLEDVFPNIEFFIAESNKMVIEYA